MLTKLQYCAIIGSEPDFLVMGVNFTIHISFYSKHKSFEKEWESIDSHMLNVHPPLLVGCVIC